MTSVLELNCRNFYLYPFFKVRNQKSAVLKDKLRKSEVRSNNELRVVARSKIIFDLFIKQIQIELKSADL